MLINEPKTSYLDSWQTTQVRKPKHAYDARVAPWLSRDPIEEEGGLNLYEMVGNDPINGVDRLGLEKIFFDSRGTEVGRDRTWWFFSTTKFIEDPKGNVRYCGKKHWEEWEHNADSLPGSFRGVTENFKPQMKAFVNANNRRWSFTDMIFGYHYSVSLGTVFINSPTGQAWDYKARLESGTWFIYNQKAYRFDIIGNITWGAIMNPYEWHVGLAKEGAGAFQTYKDISNDRFDAWRFISNFCNFGDDHRDSAAILLGYEF